MKKKIVKNTLFRQLAIFSNILSKLLILVIIARVFGPEKFGIYSLVFVVYNYLLVFSGIGLGNYVFYRYSKERNEKIDADFNNILTIVLIFISILISAVLFILIILGSDQDVFLSSLFLNLGLVFEIISGIFFYLLDAKERMVESSLLRMGINIFPLGLITLAVFILHLDFIYVFLCFLISKISIFIITLSKMNRSFNFTLSFRKPDFKKGFQVLKESLPFAFNNLFTLGLNRADILILSIVSGNYAIGIYNTSLSLILRLNSLIKPFINAVFPRLNYTYKNGNNKFKNLFRNSAKIILTSGTFFFVMFFLGTSKIVSFFWGDKYIQTIPVLKIHSLMIILKFINPFFANMLTISGNQIKRTKLILYAFLFNLALNIYLIPTYSYMGAAYSALATQIFITLGLIMMFIGLKVRIYMDYLLVMKLALITSLFIILSSFIPSLNFFLYLILITASFTVMSVLTRIVTKEEFLKVVYLFK